MNAPLNPPRCRPRDADLCFEVRGLTAALGRSPIITEISRWVGFGPGIGGRRVHGLVHRALATLAWSVMKTPMGPRRCQVVELTSIGNTAAASSFGMPDAPHTLEDEPTPAPRVLEDERDRSGIQRFEPGFRKGTRELVCVIGAEIMTRCVACGFEHEMQRAAWAAPSDNGPCKRCDRCELPRLSDWLADVPNVTPPTPEEREELLDLFLAEVGRAPFGEDARLEIARVYIAEHHPQHACTLEQIGAVLGVTRERVRQMQAKAETKLRARLSRDGQAAGIVEELRDLDITRHGEG